MQKNGNYSSRQTLENAQFIYVNVMRIRNNPKKFWRKMKNSRF